MTDTAAPMPSNLNALQLLDLTTRIIWDLSPRVSVGIRRLMHELVTDVDDEEELLRDRVAVSLLAEPSDADQSA